MHKTIVLPLFVQIFLLFSGLSYSQKPFKGVIEYDIIYESEKEANRKESDKILPLGMKIFYRSPKVKIEIANQIGKSVIIGDAEEESTVVLLDVLGSKLAIKNTKAEREKAMGDLPKVLIRYTENTKTIAGYLCEEVEIIQGENTMNAFFTEEIKIENPNWLTEYKDINGVLLEYTQISDNMKTRYIAKKIEKMNIKKKEFEIPENYKQISKQELTKLLSK